MTGPGESEHVYTSETSGTQAESPFAAQLRAATAEIGKGAPEDDDTRTEEERAEAAIRAANERRDAVHESEAVGSTGYEPAAPIDFSTMPEQSSATADTVKLSSLRTPEAAHPDVDAEAEFARLTQEHQAAELGSVVDAAPAEPTPEAAHQDARAEAARALVDQHAVETNPPKPVAEVAPALVERPTVTEPLFDAVGVSEPEPIPTPSTEQSLADQRDELADSYNARAAEARAVQDELRTAAAPESGATDQQKEALVTEIEHHRAALADAQEQVTGIEEQMMSGSQAEAVAAINGTDAPSEAEPVAQAKPETPVVVEPTPTPEPQPEPQPVVEPSYNRPRPYAVEPVAVPAGESVPVVEPSAGPEASAQQPAQQEAQDNRFPGSEREKDQPDMTIEEVMEQYGLSSKAAETLMQPHPELMALAIQYNQLTDRSDALKDERAALVVQRGKANVFTRGSVNSKIKGIDAQLDQIDAERAPLAEENDRIQREALEAARRIDNPVTEPNQPVEPKVEPAAAPKTEPAAEPVQPAGQDQPAAEPVTGPETQATTGPTENILDDAPKFGDNMTPEEAGRAFAQQFEDQGNSGENASRDINPTMHGATLMEPGHENGPDGQWIRPASTVRDPAVAEMMAHEMNDGIDKAAAIGKEASENVVADPDSPLMLEAAKLERSAKSTRKDNPKRQEKLDRAAELRAQALEEARANHVVSQDTLDAQSAAVAEGETNAQAFLDSYAETRQAGYETDADLAHEMANAEKPLTEQAMRMKANAELAGNPEGSREALRTSAVIDGIQTRANAAAEQARTAELANRAAETARQQEEDRKYAERFNSFDTEVKNMRNLTGDRIVENAIKSDDVLADEMVTNYLRSEGFDPTDGDKVDVKVRRSWYGRPKYIDRYFSDPTNSDPTKRSVMYAARYDARSGELVRFDAAKRDLKPEITNGSQLRRREVNRWQRQSENYIASRLAVGPEPVMNHRGIDKKPARGVYAGILERSGLDATTAKARSTKAPSSFWDNIFYTFRR